MITLNKKSGFTIIETLVAVTILMIAIAGPLSIASKSFNAAMTARDQLIASYLAQESMEVIKNTRDNNLYLGVPWLTGFPGQCPESSPCDASAIDNPNIFPGAVSPLKINSGYYSRISSGTNTAFSRRFYLTPTSSSNEYLVTVIVTWNSGTVPYEVRLVSNLINNVR